MMNGLRRGPGLQPLIGRWFCKLQWKIRREPRTRSGSSAGYWAPVNAYIRRWQFSPADADDLTQQFFARFLEKKHYKQADRNRGKFRTFLLTSVKNFLVNERERACAQKRGGGQAPVSLDEHGSGLGRASADLVDERTAERIYEQRWALTLLTQVRTRLAAEYVADGGEGRFTVLEQFLPGEESGGTYAEVAARLEIAEGTLKSEVHRFKKRYRVLLREEIQHTVSDPRKRTRKSAI